MRITCHFTFHIVNKTLLLLLLLTLPCMLSAQNQIRTDILVVGGGASGITAGIQSARLGVKTIIAEESSWLGGMITAAGVSAFDGNHNIPSGLWMEFRNRIYTHYGGPDKVSTGWVSNTQFEPHVGDSIFKKMASKENNLQVMYHLQFKKVIKNNQTVQGALFTNLLTGKEVSIFAKVTIEATELGDVLKSAGIPYDVGLESGKIADENVGVMESSNIVQDLTYVAILKDFGIGVNMTIKRPQDYDPMEFDGACTDYYINHKRVAPTVSAKKMLEYAKLPGNKYMLNWPKYGNDIYLNIIEMSGAQRITELKKAKEQTLRFVYFIQDQLGYKNLGLADDEFPTADKLAIMPYHRESRRVKGLVRYNMRYLAEPYSYKFPLYRTGIAVGDYPVDHHHKKNPEAPQQFEFYSIPSFNVPLGALIPAKGNGLVIAEKSISVSNVINGATRLQPCVMLIGQAAGTLAALSVKQNQQIDKVSVRNVQASLLKSKGMLMPYIDATPDSKHFESIQRIGATGILKGKGIPKNWANQTWFYPDGFVDVDTLKQNMKPFGNFSFPHEKNLSIGGAIKLVQSIAIQHHLKWQNIHDKIWHSWDLIDFEKKRLITRNEFSVLMDKTIDPFTNWPIDHFGNPITQ